MTWPLCYRCLMLALKWYFVTVNRFKLTTHIFLLTLVFLSFKVMFDKREMSKSSCITPQWQFSNSCPTLTLVKNIAPFVNICINHLWTFVYFYISDGWYSSTSRFSPLADCPWNCRHSCRWSWHCTSPNLPTPYAGSCGGSTRGLSIGPVFGSPWWTRCHHSKVANQGFTENGSSSNEWSCKHSF